MAAKEETGLVFSQRRKNIQKRGSSLGRKETKESRKNLGFSKSVFFMMENKIEERVEKKKRNRKFREVRLE